MAETRASLLSGDRLSSLGQGFLRCLTSTSVRYSEDVLCVRHLLLTWRHGIEFYQFNCCSDCIGSQTQTQVEEIDEVLIWSLTDQILAEKKNKMMLKKLNIYTNNPLIDILNSKTYKSQQCLRT